MKRPTSIILVEFIHVLILASTGARGYRMEDSRVLLTPKELYLSQKAVQEAWHLSTKYFDYSNTSQAARVNDLLGQEVPGLTTDGMPVSFKSVFDAFASLDCPIMLFGGIVRDLVGGKNYNDVDCVAFCDGDVVEKIFQKNNWPSNNLGFPKYFAFGNKHLEGVLSSTIFTQPYTVENTANALLWSINDNLVIDPTGHGKLDAEQKIIRPPLVGSTSGGSPWNEFRTWTYYAFVDILMGRHVRYLKLRMRSWQPMDECFSYFMAKEFVAMLRLEPTRIDEPGSFTFRSLGGNEKYRVMSFATSLFLHFFLKDTKPEDLGISIKSLFAVFLEMWEMVHRPGPKSCMPEDTPDVLPSEDSVEEWFKSAFRCKDQKFPRFLGKMRGMLPRGYQLIIQKNCHGLSHFMSGTRKPGGFDTGE